MNTPAPIRLSTQLENPQPMRVPSVPSFEIIERTIRRISDKYDAPAQPPQDATALLDDMLQRIESDRWDGVSLSFVTRVAGFAFAADFLPVGRYDRIRAFLLAELAASTRGAFVNAMLRVYFDSFVLGAAHTALLARALQGARHHIGPRWQDLLQNIPDVLDAEHAPAAIAGRMVLMDDPWHGLRALGLRQPHAPGLMDAAHLAFVGAIAADLNQRPQIERLLGWLKPDGDSLRQVGAGAAINALLRPWAATKPPAEIESLLIDRLTQFYGHPRVARHAAWGEVDPALERIFLRWLMGADFRMLFRVLKQVENGHMWAEREQFWWTMLQQGKVDELWVAFRPEGYRLARSLLPEGDEKPIRRFARQSGNKERSLLIMRIGNRIVVEGTYNFSVRIFDAAHPRAPTLYQDEYSDSDIIYRPNLDAIPHQGSSWQNKVMWALR